MKKIFIIVFAACVYLSACNGAHNKTGGATRDSSASHGYGGPADTTTSATGQSATSSGSSDTSTLGDNATYPATDTVKKKKP
jgi:predicted small secreted protein